VKTRENLGPVYEDLSFYPLKAQGRLRENAVESPKNAGGSPPSNTISFLLPYRFIFIQPLSGRTNWIGMNLFLRFYSTNYLLKKADVRYSQRRKNP
jgi:hypothetical protein